MRERILHISAAAVFSFLLLGIFYTQILRGGYYTNLSKRNCIRVIPQKGARGRIIDRNGIVVVDNYLSFDVVALPQELTDKERSIPKLASLIGTTAENIKGIIKKDFTAPFAPITIKEDIPQSTMMLLKEAGFELPGIEIQALPRRHYPFGSAAAHAIGYLGYIDRSRFMKLKAYGYEMEDIVGYSGVEEQCEKFLGAVDGGKQIEVDHRGRFVRLLGYKNARDGKDVKLTIDLKMQQIVEEVLAGHKGAIVVIEPNTGEVLAMASFPNFNPNVFIKRSLKAQLKEALTGRSSPLLNRAIGGQYAPGSIFKIVVAAAALELNKIGLNTSFNCPGYFQVGSREFGCWDTHGWQNIIAALTHSCDTFFYNTGLLLGADNIAAYAVKFGIGRPSGIDLPYEPSGVLPSPMWKKLRQFKGWYPGDTVNLSIGQGDLMMTPLQAAVMTAAIANGGRLIKPYIISEVDGKAFTRGRSTPLSLKKETIKYIRSGLKGVVDSESGTASILSGIPGLTVSGKTGTAQVGSRQPHAWFVGYSPQEGAKAAFCVFLENAGSSTYACALARTLLERFAKEGLL
ncbi:MAG: penicillin-binding protein 2 [Candidatus Omnitrophica bacterium]|nr:penicillin-binding protein 2 [Candidatus Omnitrophota bacterium]